MKRRAAFTLTELLVVIGIAMLVMAMGAIGFRDALQNQRIKGAAAELQGVIIRSRSEAVTKATEYYGHVTVDPPTYQLWDTADETGNKIGKPVVLPEAVSIEIPASDGLITFRVDGTINWDWTATNPDATDGEAGYGSKADIKLKDRSGVVASFNLVENTGAVRFFIIK